MSYRKTINTTTVVVETNVDDGAEIHVSTTSSPYRSKTYVTRNDYAEKSRMRSPQNRNNLTEVYYSRSPAREARVDNSYTKKAQMTSSTLAQTQEKSSRRTEQLLMNRDLEDKYMSPSPQRRTVQAGSGIKIDKSSTRFYNPDTDHFYN